MLVNKDTLVNWVRASLFLACCDGELAESEKAIIERLAADWSGWDNQAAHALVRSELTGLFASNRHLSIDCIFPDGISCEGEQTRAFVTRLLAVKQADGVSDARELEVIFDVLELLPGAISLPSLDLMRADARALVASDTSPVVDSVPAPEVLGRPARQGFLSRVAAVFRR